MKNIANKKIIKINEKNYGSVARFIQEDDAVLTIELYREGVVVDATGQTVSLNCLRADGIEIEQLSDITINKTLITINFKNNILQVKGDVFCQLALIDSIGGMSTSEFKITVDRKIITVDSISAADLETINSIKKAEALRVEAENTRKTNETSRANTENTRIVAENTRKANEETRENRENTRKVNETNRVTAENKRVEAENTRKANEEIRKTNEIDRNNKFNETETDAKNLIEQMQTTVDTNIGTEVIEARGTKASLNERLNENDSSILSNANEISDIILALAECIKKDGSAKIADFLDFGETGTNKLTGIRNNRGCEMLFQNQIQLRNTNATETVNNFAVVFGGDGVYPGESSTGKLNLGAPSRPWKDVWVGGINKEQNGCSIITNGIIIQWGSLKSPTTSGTRVVYPAAFPNSILHVYATIDASTFPRVRTYSCDRFAANIAVDSVHSDTSVRWLAIGY